jgi:hypothetical protein
MENADFDQLIKYTVNNLINFSSGAYTQLQVKAFANLVTGRSMTY